MERVQRSLRRYAWAGIIGLSIAGLQVGCVSTPDHSSGVPVFEVDSSWPKVPSKWKLGDASSVDIDANDNVFVLHRPRTLKPDQAGMAAPPVLVFDREVALVALTLQLFQHALRVALARAPR